MRTIDSQVHIYERDSGSFPWAPSAKDIIQRAAAVGVFLPPAVSAENLITMMDRIAVDAAILVSFGGIYEFDNSYALDAVSRFPDRFAVVGRLDPLSENVEQDVADFALHPGTVGLRVLAYLEYQDQFLAGAYERMFAAIEASGLAMCIYAPESLAELHRVAKQYSNLQIVLDHMCLRSQPPYTLEVDPFAALPQVLELARHPNVAVKLSGMAPLSRRPFPFEDLWPSIHGIVDAFGPERVMWGSDTTRTSLEYSQEIDFIRKSTQFSGHAKALILGESLSRIFKFYPPRRAMIEP